MPAGGIQGDMLSGIEEETDVYEAFQTHVDTKTISLSNESSPAKKQPLKTIQDVKQLIQQGKKREVKLLLRENNWPVNATIRSQLWPELCSQHRTITDQLSLSYWESVNITFGTVELTEKTSMLPPFVEQSNCLKYHLTKKGEAVADRIVNVIYNDNPDITWSPTLYPICSILLHFLTEEEAYNCLISLIKSKEKVFITQTKLLHEVTWKTIQQFTKMRASKSEEYLQKFCTKDIKAEKLFSEWIWWIFRYLPFPHLVRVMDCFFNEGIKVLYRVAIAIIILFHAHTSKNPTEWSEETLRADIKTAMENFCRQIPVSPSKLLKTAFSIRRFSSQAITRIFIKIEMTVKSKSVKCGNRQLTRPHSSDNLPTSQSQMNIQMMSQTLTIRDGASSPDCRDVSMGSFPIHSVKSEIVETDALFTLWSWLPQRVTMNQPSLLYTTAEHGCSLTTFFLRVQHHEPTLMLIKATTQDDGKQHVFGAYCSAGWYERNMKNDKGNRQTFFGTGESFIFSLTPMPIRYSWVGREKGKQVSHAEELFMSADNHYLAIGGGDGHAIWIDENIEKGRTESCKTFGNPSLCGEFKDFNISVMEVYGFVST